MLSITDIPQHLNEMYEVYKSLAQTIYESVKGFGKPVKVESNTDIYAFDKNNPIIYIFDGYFKLTNKNKVVRFYSQFDFVTPVRGQQHDVKLISDFGSEVTLFDRTSLLNQIKKDHKIFEKWIELMDLENSINLLLASEYMPRIVRPEFQRKEFNKGDIIINEGETPEEFFEMVSGLAEVRQNEKKVGYIYEGEFFGEISLLTEKFRSATVIAIEKCMVKSISRDKFFEMIDTSLNFSNTISRVLARRVASLNDRITRPKSPLL